MKPVAMTRPGRISIVRSPRMAWLLAAGLLAAGCGGTGTIEVQLAATTEAPDGVRSIILALEAVEVHAKLKKPKGKSKDKSKDKGDKAARKADRRGSKGGWMALEGAPAEIDLAALRDDVRATLGALELPEGKVTKIRLRPDLDGRNEVHLADGTVCALDLSGIGRKGIQINHPFKAIDVKAGEVRPVVVVIDLRQSVEAGEGECAYRLKPVIKIKPAPGENEDDDGPEDGGKDKG